MGSISFEAKRQSLDATSVWTVHLHFPAFGLLPAKDFYWSSGEKIELEDGNIYVGQLRSVPRGRFQKDRGNDYAEFSVSNPEGEIYAQLQPYENLVEKAVCIIREAFALDIDLFESEIRYYGYIKDFTVNDGDHSVDFTSLSDMSRPGFLVGNRILTRERCGTEFNVNGLNDPAFHKCGWTTPQGGNPVFCSKLFDGVDGCNAHNNTHRFYAVPALSTVAIEVIPSSDIDPGGWDHESGACFASWVRVLMADGTTLPIGKVQPGMKNMGYDVFDNDKLIPSIVLDHFTDTVRSVDIANFDGVVLGVRYNHLFYIGNRLYVPVAALGQNLAFGMDSARKPVQATLRKINKLFGAVSVHNLRTSSHNFIVTDSNAEIFLFVHNEKPILPMIA